MLIQCPKFTPLQTRLIASVTALALLALVYYSLASPHFAYAAELPHDGTGELRTIEGEQHLVQWEDSVDPIVQLRLDPEHEGEDAQNDAQKDEITHSRRALQTETIRGNNIATRYDLSAGNTTLLEFPNRFLIGNHTESGKGLPGTLDRRTTGPIKPKHAELKKRSAEGLEARQDTESDRTIFISANVCMQPTWNGTGTQSAAPPQLTLYVANSADSTSIGPGVSNQTQAIYPFDSGFVNASVPNATGTWNMAVSAPALPDGFVGSWTYTLAASIDDYFYSVNTTGPFLHLVDTDYDSALLVTDNLTSADSSDSVYQQWMNLTAPFIIFASDANLTGLWGMENSFCGLETFAKGNNQIQASQTDLQGNGTHVQMGMITRGLGNKPKEQFYVTNLNSSSEYRAFLAIEGNSTASGDGVVGGGGKVWQPVPFSTKSDGNCQLLFNMSFCDEVAYAVPSNPKTMPTFEDLQRFYENHTTTWWAPFNWTLAQIPCNTTSESQYSLAKNCTNCAAAYKEWLCAVSIPRCEDFSSEDAFLQVRNVGQPFFNNDTMLDSDFLNSNYVPMPDAPTVQGSNAFSQTYLSNVATNRSRNGLIDEVIQPGPYKEILPCEDLCYSLMQSCPAAMGFVCPYPGRGLEAGYGKRSKNGSLTCSYLGAVYYQNDAAGLIQPVWKTLLVTAAVTWALAFG
ncbi:unnamed protein product [Zymoseptoria tritici ST99CH_1E4]|uniref:FZ domain-containing protein n=1 Tax=Zymoseptoria tritici ST99CH_1E4 TaxID=1276532 RepID=A0A2H1FYQ9_ZYMTR|nr:unnamed protein product [Zymoseptoria tritici ST99CH_1E4]